MEKVRTRWIDAGGSKNKPLPYFFEKYGITASPEETAKCYEQNLAYEHEKVDGALELLQELHGKYRLYAASNGTYEVQRRRIEESGIKPYFEDFLFQKNRVS